MAVMRVRSQMLPNLVVIGAMKCGTTSLHRYLGLHPEIGMAAQKELNFFIAEANWGRGPQWYAAQFERRRERVRGESSPSYTHHPVFRGVAARMHSLIPGARLIYLVRDPVERLVSHWVHEYAAGVESRGLPDAVSDLEASPYVTASCYFAQLEQFLGYFTRDQILVVRQEDLLHDRAATLARIFSFLEVDASFQTTGFERLDHRSGAKRRRSALGRRLSRSQLSAPLRRLPSPVRRRVVRIIERPFSKAVARPVVPADLERRLRRHLRKDGNSLRALTGLPIEHWYD